MGRVFLNLLDNAFDSVRARTEAARQAGVEGYQPYVRVATQRGDGVVLIRIEDNGTGIPERLQERVFEPFFTTKRSGEGTGLGLSLAYEIVTAGHGGSMEVVTAEGVGTTFTITLPAEPADGADTPAPPAQTAAAPGER